MNEPRINLFAIAKRPRVATRIGSSCITRKPAVSNRSVIVDLVKKRRWSRFRTPESWYRQSPWSTSGRMTLTCLTLGMDATRLPPELEHGPGRSQSSPRVNHRRQCIKEIGLFDELLGSYLEDVELGYYARAAGWDVVIVEARSCSRSRLGAPQSSGTPLSQSADRRREPTRRSGSRARAPRTAVCRGAGFGARRNGA